MVFVLDAKDRKLLYELDKNSRQPVSRIAKAIGLSVDGTNYRLKRLIQNKVIFKFGTLLDTAKLGRTTYKTFYRFQNTTIQKEKEIVNYLVDHPNTQLVTTTQGLYDLNVNFMASTVEELNHVLTTFNLKYGEFLAESEVNILVSAHFYFRDYLVSDNASEIRKPMSFGSRAKSVKLDEVSKKILALLTVDARTSAVQISKKVGLGSDAVIQRIKKLQQLGLIQNYVLFLNPEVIGYTWYYFLIKFRDLTPDQEKKFFAYCQLNPNIWCHHSKMIGPWDSVINLDVKNDEELKLLLMTIKKEFSGIIKEYNILKIIETLKFNQYELGQT